MQEIINLRANSFFQRQKDRVLVEENDYSSEIAL